MAKIIEKIVLQPNPPKDTNVGWHDGARLNFFNNGKWEGSTSSNESSSLLDIAVEPSISLNINYGTYTFEELGINKNLENKLAFYYLLMTGIGDSTYLNLKAIESELLDFMGAYTPYSIECSEGKITFSYNMIVQKDALTVSLVDRTVTLYRI